MLRHRRFRSRLIAATFCALVIAMLVVACGIDVVASRVFDVTDAANETSETSLPRNDGSVLDGTTDGGTDADVFIDSGCGPACTTAGGACSDAGTCVFVCNTVGGCEGGVTCPPDIPCRVQCSKDDACRSLVDCTQASSCSIVCSGKRSCDQVTCAGTSCTVACSGDDSCSDGGVTCTSSGSCNVQCTAGGPGSCASPVRCTSARCDVGCTKAKDCTSTIDVDAGDASVTCAKDACTLGATCIGGACSLDCGGGLCDTKLCCDAGVCNLVGGDGTACP